MNKIFIPDKAEVIPLNKNLFDLQGDDCRYPYGDGPDYTFCGHVATFGSSYCAAHNKIVYRKFDPNGDRKRG